MKWLSTLCGMSHNQLQGYYRKHRRHVDALYARIEKSGGKSFPEWKLFSDLVDGYEILENLFRSQESHYQKQIEELNTRISDLEERLHLNPENSHKPPSSERFKKIKSQRVKSGKPIGAQKGHVGHGPQLSDDPDQVIRYEPQRCRSCGRPLKSIKDDEVIRKQVVDLKNGQPFITEYQRVTKYCPDCGDMNRGEVPGESMWSRSKKIFGPNVKSVALYLMGYQILPVARTQEMLLDLYGVLISQGSLCNFVKEISTRLHPWELSLKSQLIRSRLLHADETGMRCEKRNDWVHVASNEKLTLLTPHITRGFEAQKEIGVLPEFKGQLVHDGFKSYDQFDRCSHSLCNAHILRELKFLFEEDNQQWALKMSEFLKHTLHQIHHDRERTKSFLLQVKRTYRRHLRLGFTECGYAHEYKGRPPDWYKTDYQNGKRIKVAKFRRRKLSKAMNLLVRLRDSMEQVLSFVLRPRVPFTNNQAERDLRMLKVKEKISGCFRSQRMAKDFLRFRSFLSTLRKQNLHLLDNIHLALVLDI